ncbi:BRCA1-associated ATM activator 1-like [Oncorhynchus kisutch]|uniref:BRCA1-associated ATM activator 1 n=1 Tax=Oncorhynchus kisutch TaxID=8019 RepID=A0A8C7MZ57_ONCKI|nr:BRCA1-associated ATM activator 1-like [Oncorhynchus kisutch]
MDSECLVLLPRVCAVLADPRQSLPDDTSLEKLLDWFTGLTKEDHGLALLESCPCLVDYISTACLDKTTDPSMLSFSLKLSGLLAASQHGFNLLQDRSILGVAYDSKRWQVAGLWEDPSVRIGWIQGLSNMMRHTQAFHFLDQAGLTKPLLQLQTDPSLFVASAANHLLARLLTFHQPTTTAHTTQGNGFTVPPNKEEVELDVTMETSPGRGCSITMEILKHLESSLESDSHTQVLQGLRLLALTLPELEAPLRGSVIRRVLGPLEGLVREGRRAVALMDVLLATYRSGPCDSRLVSLMASMLNSQNPSDAALCAAATLHPETCPPGLRQKVVAVLLGPLQMVTGVTLLDWTNDRHTDQQTDHRHTDQQTDHRHTDRQTDHRHTDQQTDHRHTDQQTDNRHTDQQTDHRHTDEDHRQTDEDHRQTDEDHKQTDEDHRQTDEDHRQTDTDQDRQTEGRSSLSLLLDHLNHKPSCVSLLCVSVSSAPYITDMDSSASVILAVVSLLRICNGHSPSPESKAAIGCSKASTNLIGCSKVQRCCLNSLASLSTCPGAVERVVEVFHVLVQNLQNPDSDPTVLQKNYQAMLRWLSVSAEPNSLTDLVTEDLLPVLKKRVCDVRWEVRDSTLEFLGQLCEALSCTVTPILLEALCDQESYVRASAISALARTLPLSDQQGEPGNQTQEQTLGQLLDILSQDSEGFPRRAVVQFFISWLKTHPSSSSSSSSLCSVLSLGSTDLDWEVKVHTLELVELLMEETLPGHQESELGSAPPPYGGSGGTNLLTHTDLTHPYAVTPSQPSPLLTHTDLTHPYAVTPSQPSPLTHTHPTDTHTHPTHTPLTHTPPTHTHPTTSVVCGLSRLVELGVVTALLNGLFDCDRPVALKACSLLLRLRDAVCPSRSLGKGAMTTDDTTVAKVTFDLRGQVWEREVTRKLQEKRGSDWVKESREVGCDRPNKNRDSDRTDGAGSEACERSTGKSVCEGSARVCEALWSLGLEERQSVLSQSSDHVQNSPLSLLDDILNATDTSHTDEVIVDCY